MYISWFSCLISEISAKPKFPSLFFFCFLVEVLSFELFNLGIWYILRYCMRWGLIYFNIKVQSFQCNLLKTKAFSNWIILAHCWILIVSICVDLFLGFLFHWSVCMMPILSCLTLALELSIEIRECESFIFLLHSKISLSILDPLGFHMNFSISF